MSSTIPSAPVSTKQAATGRATVRTVQGRYELMLWTSGGKGNPVCFGSCEAGTFEPKVRKTGVSGYPGTGPAFVPMPGGTSGYLVWVNPAQRIAVSQAAASAADPPVWTLTGKAMTIATSKAAGGPAAALQMQNGQLVLTIVWQDLNAGSMVYTQIAPEALAAATPPAFARLAESCLDAPCMVKAGASNCLAYMDPSGAFNLAVDPAGGVDFDFGRRFTTTAVSSAYGPAFVPLGRNQAYVFWGTAAGLNYQQMGINTDGDWQLNGRSGCSGTLSGIVPTAAPSAAAASVVSDGVTWSAIQVAAPSSGTTPANTVLVAGIMPDHSPLPLPQLQLVTS